MAGKENSVLIADVYTACRSGLRQLLEAARFRVVGEAGDAGELEMSLEVNRPSVLLIAYNMSPEEGVEFFADLGRRFPGTRIVLLLPDAEDLPVRDLVQAGVLGLIQKSEPESIIVRAVRTAFVNGTTFSRQVLEKLIGDSPPSSFSDSDVDLTQRELELLQLLSFGNHNHEIAVFLNLSVKTVEKYLSLLYAKLEVKNRAAAAAWYIRRQESKGYPD
ncbi:MAG TPA: response regulator transcription factor [Promineifilum sp.]